MRARSRNVTVPAILLPEAEIPISRLLVDKPNTNLSELVFREPDAGILKGLLNLQYGFEVAFQNAFALFDPLKCCESDAGRTCQRRLAPTQERSGRPNLG
jgi:hypothetical protein